MNSGSNASVKILEINLNNEGKNNPKGNSNANYQELIIDNYNKDNDNSGDGLSNSHEENEEEQEQDELSIVEINHLKKIQEKILFRQEKYANLCSPQNLDKNYIQSNDSNEKINHSSEDNNITHNNLEIFSENDNEHINEQKINPNRERVFKNIHCYFYLNDEPLIIIGPNLGYFIWIFTLISFFSVLIYSLKSWKFFNSILFFFGYFFFAISYILLMVVNPGVPSEKKNFDVNDLNYNYIQCKICNCIYHKNELKNVNHCQECGICVEGCQHHCNFATKCIGKKNKNIFKLWICSCIALIFIMFFYLIF